MALHNYHNAHENKRLVSQRTSELMWCQLVSEADHSLPFFRGKEKQRKKRKGDTKIEVGERRGEERRKKG